MSISWHCCCMGHNGWKDLADSAHECCSKHISLYVSLYQGAPNNNRSVLTGDDHVWNNMTRLNWGLFLASAHIRFIHRAHFCITAQHTNDWHSSCQQQGMFSAARQMLHCTVYQWIVYWSSSSECVMQDNLTAQTCGAAQLEETAQGWAVM